MENNKNLWVIQTDKPSRVAITDTNVLGMYKVEQIAKYGKNQNIYITNNEVPKAGDYAIATLNGNSEVVQLNQSTCIYYDSKIILTTDQDLIKDGVQAIDDEFLEWFVKNPSCEIIEVEKAPYDGTKSIDKYWGGEYKITIPKEEPKQETLEEVAERKFLNIGDRLIFEDGAKWQKENSNENALDFEIKALKSLIQDMDATIKSKYSEEEVKDFLFKWSVYKISAAFTDGEILDYEQWFEQIKKK